MIVTVSNPDGSHNEWEVWVQLCAGDPETLEESFIIGTGMTRRDAVIMAALSLATAATKLLSMETVE